MTMTCPGLFCHPGLGGLGKNFPQTNHHPPLSPTAENVMTRNWNAHAPVDDITPGMLIG